MRSYALRVCQKRLADTEARVKDLKDIDRQQQKRISELCGVAERLEAALREIAEEPTPQGVDATATRWRRIARAALNREDTSRLGRGVDSPGPSQVRSPTESRPGAGGETGLPSGPSAENTWRVTTGITTTEPWGILHGPKVEPGTELVRKP